MSAFSDFVDGTRELVGKAKDKTVNLFNVAKEFLKSKAKETLVSEPTYIKNNSNIYVAGAIEKVPEILAINPNPTVSDIMDVAWGLVAAPNGGRTEYEIDGSTIPVGTPNEWRYDAVTDGNSIIVSGNNNKGYSVSTKNMTKGITFGNILSMAYSKKVTNSDFNSLPQPIQAWYNGNDLRAQVNNAAISIAYEQNKQLSLQSSYSSGISGSESSSITFKDINFESTGNTYFGFNVFFVGCTK